MASKDKQTGLTAESLMKAQQQMIESGKLSAEQLKIAQEQLAKLEELVNVFKAESALNTAMERKSEKAIEQITQVKKDASHANLGNVRDEIRNLAKTIEGKDPKANRAPLPQVWRQGADRPVMSTGGTAPAENIGSKERIQKIGGVIPGVRGAPQAKSSGGGNIISDKILTDIEKSRSPTYDKFMDLMTGKPNTGGATARVREAPSLKGGAAQIINITAKSVNVRGAITGGSTTQAPMFYGPSKSGGRGSKAEPVATGAPAAAANDENGSGFLGSAATAAMEYGSKATGMIKSGAGMLGRGSMAVGRGALGMGRSALQLGGRALATPVGATLAAGAAMYGVGRAVDYGAGKLGVGKDTEGNDLQVDKKADDANWNRMKWYHKAESGMARGIEKVGGLVAPNMARQAEADRIKKETAGLDTIESNEAKNKMKSEAKGWSSWAGKEVKNDQDTKFNKTSIFSSGQSGIPLSSDSVMPVSKSTNPAPKPAPKAKVESKSKAATSEKGDDKVLKVGKQTFEQLYGASEDKGYQAYDKAMQAAARAMEKESGPGQGVSNDARRSFLDTEMYEKYRGNMLAEMRAKSSAQATAKAPQAPSGPTVGAASAENSDIKSAPSAPVVIQAPQAGNSTTNNTTNNIMPRGDVRPNESAMERYTNNQSHFY